jgi:hypothetical protein
MIFVFGFVCLCFGAFLGTLLAGLFAANKHAEELEAFGDDCYADGYEQSILDQRAGIQRLPTHRP